MKLTVEQIAGATGGEIINRGQRQCDGVSTDSRTIEPGMLFIPIVGNRFDGHDFIKEVLERGAAGFVFSDQKLSASKAAELAKSRQAAAVSVNNTLRALGDLARFVRDSVPGLKVVAITGSTGKSTTKEMLAGILSFSVRVARNEGNLNNLVGLPLSLLALSGDVDVVVLEMGTNTPGEIARLAQIAKPDAACVTNVGPVHLEGLQTVEGVAREKGALPLALGREGIFAANCDDPNVVAMAERSNAKLICYGLGNKHPVNCRKFITARDIKIGPESSAMILKIGKKESPVTIHAPGIHNVMNALAAAALASGIGSSIEEIAAGVDKWRPMEMRSEVRKLGRDVTVIVDCYNSNPVSLLAALKIFEKFSGRRVAVIGDMLELGDFAAQAHYQAGAAAANSGVKILVAVGEWAETIKKGFIEQSDSGAEALAVENAEKASASVLERIRDGDVILVKASRLLHLETVVEAIVKVVGVMSERNIT